MSSRILIFIIVVFSAALDAIEPTYTKDLSTHLSDKKAKQDWSKIPKIIESSFTPPPELICDFGTYKSLLTFQNGKLVKTAADWQRRRKEIIAEWRSLIGFWPELIEKPKIHYSEQTHRDNITQHHISIEIAPNDQTVAGYLLVPDGDGPFPAVLVVYYDAETGAGSGKELRDFGYQLAKRGFVAFSIGTPEFCSLKPPYRPLCEQSGEKSPLQPLSALAYVAANCHSVLANMPNIDTERIGIIGHSYGGKWAMFASCLYNKFTCACGPIPGSYSMKAELILITGSPGILAMNRTSNA